MQGKPKGQHKGSSVDPMVAATERMKSYCAAHPASPSAIQRPRLFVREQLWIALFGPNAEEGIIGIGATVEGALHDFDTQYLARSQTPRRRS